MNSRDKLARSVKLSDPHRERIIAWLLDDRIAQFALPSYSAKRVEIGAQHTGKPQEFRDEESHEFRRSYPTLTPDEIRLQSALVAGSRECGSAGYCTGKLNSWGSDRIPIAGFRELLK